MSLLKNHRFWIAVTFLLPFAVYAFTAYPTVPSEDAGELIAAAYTLGIAHPPGYPLYLLLGKFWSLIIPFGNVAWKLNVFSGFFAALTVSISYVLLNRITKSQFAATTSALLFAFTPIFWSQSIRAEVYTLNAFFFVFVIYLALRWFQSPAELRPRWLYFLSFVYGLSIGNHHQMLLIAPALAVFVLWREPKTWQQPATIFKAVLGFLLGFAIYFYLPLRSLANPVIDWGNPETWQNFWDVFFRHSYGGSFLPTTSVTENISFYNPSWSTRSFELFDTYILEVLSNLRHRFIFLLEDLFYQFHFLLLFIGGGSYCLFKKHQQRPLVNFIFLLAFFTGVYTLHIIFVTPLIFSRIQSQQFFIPFFIVCLIPLAFAIKTVLVRFKWRLSLLMLIAVIPVIHLATHFPTFNQRQNFIAHDIARQILAELPQNSILFMSLRDSSLFPLFYLQTVEHIRPDITIYSSSNNVYPLWLGYEYLKKDYPRQPMFSYLPVELNPRFAYRPWPLFSQYIDLSERNIISNQNLILRPQAIRLGDSIRGANLPNLPYFDRGLLAHYYIARGIGFGPNHGKEMTKYFQQAKTTAHDNYEIYFNIGNYYAHLGLYDKARPNIETAYDLNPLPEYKEFLTQLNGDTSL